LVLPEIAVVGTEPLPAVHRVIRGIHVQDDLGGGLPPSANKQVDEVGIGEVQALIKGLLDFANHRAFLQRHVRLPAREGGPGVDETLPYFELIVRFIRLYFSRKRKAWWQ
jgi:hypothetical protein